MKYLVVLSKNATHKVTANSPASARKLVWEYMSRGYTYGWTKGDFLKNAKVVKL
jgi:hypothetical protein